MHDMDIGLACAIYKEINGNIPILFSMLEFAYGRRHIISANTVWTITQDRHTPFVNSTVTIADVR